MYKRRPLFLSLVVILTGFWLAELALCERMIYVPPPKDAPGGAAEADDKSDVVVLTNQDKLSGDVLGTDGKGGIIVKHHLLGADVTVPIPSARSINFGNRKESSSHGQDSVTISNEDSFTGTITGLTKDALILETDYIGTLNLNRWMVASISLGSGGSIVLNENFSGTMKGWVPHGGVWATKNGVLSQTKHGSYYISYKVNQAGPMTFEWVVSPLSSSYISAGASIFCSATNSMYGGDSYYVLLSGNTAYLHRVRNNNTNPVVNKHMRRSVPSAKCRVEYDPDSGKIAFSVNDEVLAVYTDAAPLRKGSYFQLCSSQPSTFDNVRIVRGTGRLGVEKSTNAKEDVVFFTNGDRTSGSVRTISGGKLLMETSFGGVNVDLKKVNSVEFNGERIEEPRRRAGDAAVVLTNHDRLTIELGSLDEAVVKGRMDCAGEITVKREAVHGIKFHIYDK